MSRLFFCNWVGLLGLLMVSSALIMGAPTLAQTTHPTQTFAAPEFQQVWEQTDLAVTQGAVTRSWVWGHAPVMLPKSHTHQATPANASSSISIRAGWS